MDSRLLKPHHGVAWLENQGEWNFAHRWLRALPGAFGVKIADIDGDGDMDLAACTMTWWDDLPFNSVVWFQQQADGSFVSHDLDLSTGQHACLELADLNNDGRVDIAVGEFDQSGLSDTWITVWWNKGASDLSQGTDVVD